MLHSLATAYSSRPSSLLEIDDAWAAYQLDMLVLVIGRKVEEGTDGGKKTADGVLKEMEKSIEWKRQAKEAGRLAAGSAYRDPRSIALRKVQIPESGIW